MLVVCLSGLALRRYAERVRDQADETQKIYLDRDQALDDLRFQSLSLAIDLRDYLLESSSATSEQQRAQLVSRRETLLRSLSGIDRLAAGDSATRQALRKQTEDYLDSLDTALRWTPKEKREQSADFLRERVLPRMAVIEQASLLASRNVATLQYSQTSVRQALDAIQAYSIRGLLLVLGLGLCIAGLTIVRTNGLENRADRHREEIQGVTDELRQLSQKLVKVQEEERKSISRELHDEVGQMLTALRMEIGNAEALLASTSAAAAPHLQAAVALAEQTVRAVRDLARGLRPSMLDELGLGPALNWQARQFSRHSNLPVHLNVDDSLDHLPENYRTCIYRVAQEALTNCARHARAKEIHLTLGKLDEEICLTIQDDGIGFDAEAHAGHGIGLVGIKERVRELGGKLSIMSSPQKGTVLKVKVPLMAEMVG
jgi:signal transduction histidine kinase